ncbi:hypothetical protein GM418_11000 [Maribellus comscasis]|uniref:Uncharacterized protein n=1 Tax=Maribellus comscasis TaxID=2681766 RepID=A0A6I6JVR2_9BACT|nr:hypothetical protein [Maribellus comscasis]QGY44167.1 hypothetical protein GM418_11000 [Maribellus comscasis]
MKNTAQEYIENPNENKLRRELQKQGYLLNKSKVKNINTDNLGGFLIVDTSTNAVVAGSRYELNKHDVYRFIFE